MTRAKIALIGAGGIGGMLASFISLKDLGDVVLCDISEGITKGKALDVSHAAVIVGHSAEFIGVGSDYSAIKGADVCVVTAGLSRKPGMSREDLLKTNLGIIRAIGKEIGRHAPNAFVVCVTNPLDSMVWALQKASGLPYTKVIGMAGVLDSARFRYLLAQRLNVSPLDIHTLILGGHGDTMVPLIRYTSIAGIPLADFIASKRISQKEVDDMIVRVRNGGAEIVELLQNGSATVSPAMGAIQMIQSYLKDERRIFPCSVWLEGQYGYSDIYFGSPVVIGAGGVQDIIDLQLTDDDKKLLDASVQAVRKSIDECVCID
jgi:malate dehydrogenase